ncbi:MAG: ABC transporter ATP-binding protein [Rhodobacteraceae bacterium]|nr:ABC transporter ATP-binding protein [Paracoccaceae bacterium]
MTAPPVLQVEGLNTTFVTERGPVPSVTDVSFTINPGETVAVVGESGSGKSVTSLTIMGLLARNAQSDAACLKFCKRNGHVIDLLTLPEKQMRQIRGNEIGMIFQEPMTSLNPVLTVGRQITEAVLQHRKLTRKQATAEALDLLRMVGIPAPQDRLRQYPHQLSGGMRQRIMIAIALACRPQLLIADEPTTALDVTIQAQILDLLIKLKADLGMSILFVTHDLAVVSEIADRVIVMYGGTVIEEGPVRDVLDNPAHPYTHGLLASVPAGDGQRLYAIPGSVPSPATRPTGCLFAPRCPHALEKCRETRPPFVPVSDGHKCSCLRIGEF